MVDHHFRWFLWICIVFGVAKPLILSKGLSNRLCILHNIWSLLIIIIVILSYTLTMNGTIDFDLKTNLAQVSNWNDLILNVFIILVNLVNGGEIVKNVYLTINGLIKELKIGKMAMELVSLKIYIWFSMPVIALLIAIIFEIISSVPPFIIIMRIPAFLSMIHLFIHLYLLLATLKFVNKNLGEMIKFNDKMSFVTPTKINTFKYILDPEIKFVDDQQSDYFDIKLLCKIYDDINSYLHLLEDLHGVQIILMIWLMFSSAVIGVTLIACHQTNEQWLVIVRSILPLSWCLIGCCIDDRLRNEVGHTETLIIKYLIDYRCDKSRKNTLQTFKQLVATNRLQFTACNLFDLNYSMILGTIMNIITYSIILIQLFLSD